MATYEEKKYDFSGAAITNLAADNVTTGSIPDARFASGNYTSNQTTSGGVTAAGGHTTNYIVGSTASGTWRCMGSHGRTSSPRRLTLWHRTA